MWRKLTIDWCEYYPSLKGEEQLDTLSHLMPLDIGTLSQIMVSDPERRLFGIGYIPLMASCSHGQLGALNAESFCERVLSCANDVLTTGNTLLSDDEIEMLVVLRMNRDFMQHMRETYNHLTADHFGCTVVSEE